MSNILGIGGVKAANYIAPDTSAKAVDPRVATYPVGANSLKLLWPIPAHTQPNYAGPTPKPAFPLSSGVD
jgi:hypothetical protein